MVSFHQSITDKICFKKFALNPCHYLIRKTTVKTQQQCNCVGLTNSVPSDIYMRTWGYAWYDNSHVKTKLRKNPLINRQSHCSACKRNGDHQAIWNEVYIHKINKRLVKRFIKIVLTWQLLLLRRPLISSFSRLTSFWACSSWREHAGHRRAITHLSTSHNNYQWQSFSEHSHFKTSSSSMQSTSSVE